MHVCLIQDHLPKGTMHCMRRLRADDASYDILIDIALDDYIAEEQVADAIDIIPKLITYSEDFSKIIDNDAYAIIKKYVQYAVSKYELLLMPSYSSIHL